MSSVVSSFTSRRVRQTEKVQQSSSVYSFGIKRRRTKTFPKNYVIIESKSKCGLEKVSKQDAGSYSDIFYHRGELDRPRAGLRW